MVKLTMGVFRVSVLAWGLDVTSSLILGSGTLVVRR